MEASKAQYMVDHPNEVQWSPRDKQRSASSPPVGAKAKATGTTAGWRHAANHRVERRQAQSARAFQQAAFLARVRGLS